LALAGVLAGIYSLAPAQVYEFSKPNVPVNDDSLGRHHHFNLSQGQHSVAARGDSFYAVWWDFRNGSAPLYNADIYFARSTDCGRTFLPNLRINDDADTVRQESPSLCLDAAGIIHVAWEDTRTGNFRIFYSRSTDGGRIFLPNQQISDTFSRAAMVASNGNGIVCVGWWCGFYFWLKRSSDGGRTFGRRVMINDFAATPATNASLTLDSAGRAYVAWQRFDTLSYRHVHLSRSTDPGDTLFYPSVRVSDSTFRVWDASDPSVTLDKRGRVFVALMDKRSTGDQLHVYVARSTDGGASFLPNVDVSDNWGQSLQEIPSIAADDSGNVYVAWTDYRNGIRCIYFARSIDPEDTSFSPNILVNDTAGLSETDRYGASLAVNERGEAFVTWSDNRIGGISHVYDIFSSWGVRRQNMVEDDRTEGFVKSFRVDCYPNPFTDRVRISFFLKQPGKIGIKIYNLLGEEVKTLVQESKGSGKYEIEWRGLDKQGRPVKSGVYFLAFYPEGFGRGSYSSKTFHRLILIR